MKTPSLKPLALLIVALLTAALSHAALPAHRAPTGPARPEIKAYLQQNVLPVLRQQRQKLEPQISSTDRAQLATYRTQLRELRQKQQVLRQQARPNDAAPRPYPDLTPEQLQQRQQLRVATKALLLSVAQLAQKYEANIQALAQELQPQREKWVADLAAIQAKNSALDSARRAGMGHLRQPAGHLLRPAQFLLLDPAAPAAAPAGLGAAVYPNPAATTSQLTYEVQKTGSVTVELLDGRGTTLRTVAQEVRQEKGPHTLQTDLSGLPAGTYFYKITTRAGTETRRFVKE
jgi:Secretion system C-terminal sorting domain